MGITRKRRGQSGQMTIEMAVAMPVLIVVAVIAANAMTFFAHCAVFDRAVHEAVRVYAAAPAYGQGIGQGCAKIEEAVKSQLDDENLNISVSHRTTSLDFDEYTATIDYYPTLFGLGLRSQVFGVSMPHLSHSTRYVIDSYRAGVIV